MLLSSSDNPHSMVVVTMKKVLRILGCLAFLILAACGGTDSSAAAGPATASTSSPANHAGGTATGGPVARATATVSADGVLFVGADRARVGTTINVTVTNETPQPITVTLQDPAGSTAASAQVTGGGTGQIIAAATNPGKWTVRFDGAAIEGGLTKVITVT
jgi:hypothetical protein